MRYDSHVVGRDLLYWYQDYFSKEDDSSDAPGKIIVKENKLFAKSYNEIAKEEKEKNDKDLSTKKIKNKFLKTLEPQEDPNSMLS